MLLLLLDRDRHQPGAIGPLEQLDAGAPGDPLPQQRERDEVVERVGGDAGRDGASEEGDGLREGRVELRGGDRADLGDGSCAAARLSVPGRSEGLRADLQPGVENYVSAH